MRRILAGRIGAVVTASAIARDIDVVEIGRRPGHGRVAVVAGIAAGDMRWVLAGRDAAVVAGLAGTNDLSMIHHGCRGPQIHAMTILTDGRRENVCTVLAGCVRAIVATGAISGNACMVKIGRRPGDGRMTIVAIVTACKMSGVLSSGCDAVVTRTTTTEHLRMIYRVGRQPGDGIVAILANVGGLNVRRVLADCIGTVVAARAIADDIDVVKIGRRPARRGMTVIAVIATDNVIRVFS